MKITDVKIEDIIPYHDNPRVNEEAINVVKKSLEEFGFQQPLVLDKDNTIIVGHTRYAAATELGYKEIPCFIADNLNDEKIKAYRIMDNKSAEYASWNYGLLTKEMTDLLESDYDLSFTGFTDEELVDLGLDINLDDFAEEGLTDEDATPELVKDPVTKLGDVWVLGNHRLICGDSTSVDTIDKLMQGNKADLVFTDPPYGMSYGGGRSEGSSKKGDTVKAHGMILNDDLRGDELSTLLEDALSNSKMFSKEGAPCYVCFNYKNYKGGQWFGSKNQSDIWSMSRGNTSAYVHPTQKPVELIQIAINNSSKKGDLVIDVFAGSGSTVIACESVGRRAMCVDLDPKYCDVIIQRWQNFTGNNAVLEDTDEIYNQLQK